MKRAASAEAGDAERAVPGPAESAAEPNPYNAHVRSTQLDEATCEALARWQADRGLRSASAALRLLVQHALAADGLLALDTRVMLARAGALREAREAVAEAFDGLTEVGAGLPLVERPVKKANAGAGKGKKA